MGWEGDLGGGGVTQLVRELGGFELSQPQRITSGLRGKKTRKTE